MAHVRKGRRAKKARQESAKKRAEKAENERKFANEIVE